jgi:signal transduction histidine kinase/CheY-like chemotaxis protein
MRVEASKALAGHLGITAFLVLVPDPETELLRPALGFPQTLPGGPTWIALLHQCATSEDFAGEVAYPDRAGLMPVVGAADEGKGMVLFIGGQPVITPRALLSEFPFLMPLLTAELQVATAQHRAEAALNAEIRTGRLSHALEESRAQLSARTTELQRSLAEAALLNDELKQVMATLETRVSEEVKERMSAEERLRQGQKMEAIGQLTGGVAHDFNNLLTVILGGMDSIKRTLPDNRDFARAHRSCDMALMAVRQATTLTSRLLAFGRRQPLDPKPLEFNRLVADISELLRRTIGEVVSLEVVAGGGLWRAEVDASELERAIVNLAVNARDAMPSGGKLTIETANVSLDDDYVAALAEPVKPGQYVMIAVSDTGLGMDRSTVDRAFEPFFTTKEVGRGTGLGLSQVYGFIRQSNGHIRIYSEPDHGTTIKMYFPRTYKPHEVSVKESILFADLPTGSGTILVVEDHEHLRHYTTTTLTELGYTILEADSGPAALRVLEDPQEINLLFTDVVLPGGMTGRELAGQARDQRPGLKVLFTTGYTKNAIIHNGRLDAGVDLLGKPFTRDALAKKIRAMLARA